MLDKCDECGDYVKDTISVLHNYRICNDCYEFGTITCPYCGNKVRIEDLD